VCVHMYVCICIVELDIKACCQQSNMQCLNIWSHNTTAQNTIRVQHHN